MRSIARTLLTGIKGKQMENKRLNLYPEFVRRLPVVSVNFQGFPICSSAN